MKTLIKRRVSLMAERSARMLVRLVREEEGQDLIEYALLGVLVGIVSIAALQLLVIAVFNTYTSADAGVQGVSACTPDPGGGGCP